VRFLLDLKGESTILVSKSSTTSRLLKDLFCRASYALYPLLAAFCQVGKSPTTPGPGRRGTQAATQAATRGLCVEGQGPA